MPKFAKNLIKFFILLLIITATYFYGVISFWNKIFPYEVLFNLYKKNPRFFSKISPRPKTPRGRWKINRTAPHKTGEAKLSQDEMEKIATLPYLRGSTKAPIRSDVIVYDQNSAYPGLNFYTSGHAPEAFLVDMGGRVLFKWHREFKDIWRGPLGFFENEEHKSFWRRAHLFQNGDILAIFEGIGLVKLDKESNILWAFKGRCHHDLYVAPNGDIYVLTRKYRKDHEKLDIDGPIREDFVTVLSPDGNPIKSVSLLDCFLNSDYASHLVNLKKRGDIFHTNTIEVLEDDHPKNPLFKKGNILLSFREIHTVAVVDMERTNVVWALTGLWKLQHQPTFLDNGNLLVFDNLGDNGKSKIIEIDPLTQKIVWSFRSTPNNEFFSNSCGSNQRLPNGNTLITESDKGRALEVTTEGRIVWEFNNPHRAGKENELIATLFEIIRIELDEISFLETK
jgi:hypothetical protein